MQARRVFLGFCALGMYWMACESGAGGGGGDADADADTDTDVVVDCRETPLGPGCPCDGEPQLCYTGPPFTMNVGICAQGTIQCTADGWTECLGQTLPRAEAQPLNGLDDDCNGFVDDGLCEPDLACAGGCCEEFEVCYKGQCSDPAGDSDSDVDACNDERENATNSYYGGGFCCTNVNDEVCVDGGSGDCYPREMCDACCGGENCQVSSRYCGYRY